MDGLKVIGPILATALQITIRFAAGRNIEKKNYIELFTEIPMNIIFLSTSFMLIHLFSHETTDKSVLVLFVICLIISFIIMLIYRKCKDILDAKETRNQIWLFTFLLLLNYSSSLTCIYKASLKFGEKTEQTNIENSSTTKTNQGCK